MSIPSLTIDKKFTKNGKKVISLLFIQKRSKGTSRQQKEKYWNAMA